MVFKLQTTKLWKVEISWNTASILRAGDSKLFRTFPFASPLFYIKEETSGRWKAGLRSLK